MSIKDTIIKELLDCADDPSGLDEVLKRHSRSKGPLYSALAAATTKLLGQYEEVLQEAQMLGAQRDQAESEIQTLEERRRSLEQTTQGLEKEIGQKEARLSEVQGLLDAADRLESQGFTAENLDRLFDFLAGLAASQGELPEDGVTKFFELLEHWSGVVSLELETQRAKVKMETAKSNTALWGAKAKEKEARAKARIATIDTVEELLAKGVKEQDILEWANVSAKANLPPRALATQLAKLGTLETLIRDKNNQHKRLANEVVTLQSQTNILTRNKDAIHLSIENIKIRALDNIELAGGRAKQYVDKLGEAAVAFGTITAEAATLGRHVALAKVLRSQDPEAWGTLLPSDFKQLLLGFLSWIKKHDFNPQIAPSQGFQRRLFISRYNAPTLSELILWAVSALFTKEERAALTGKL